MIIINASADGKISLHGINTDTLTDERYNDILFIFGSSDECPLYKTELELFLGYVLPDEPFFFVNDFKKTDSIVIYMDYVLDNILSDGCFKKFNY